MDTGIIEHEGIVQCAEKGVVHVKITSRSACGACKARQACGMAETQEKIVVVPTPEAGCYAPGEAVCVGVRKKAGRIAVLLAYGGALVVLLAALILMLDEGNSDYAIQVMITSARAGLLNSVMYTVANAYLQFNHSLPS